MMKTDKVFGIAPEVREYSYVDRGNLDSEMITLLGRDTHIAVKGPSKCGKSWLRKKVIERQLVVQCRLKKPFTDIYVDALSQLGINILIKESHQGTFRATIGISGEAGTELLTKVGLKAAIGGEKSRSKEEKVAGHDINDLRYVADIIKASGYRLVIEDFHYMSDEDKKYFAFDLKTLWDYGLFVVIVGIWSQTNLMLHLNQDLSGRVIEISIDWSLEDLKQVILKGGEHLRIDFKNSVIKLLIERAYSNAGLLQQLILKTLDEAGITEGKWERQLVDSEKYVNDACMYCAELLNPVYQQFARTVAAGIRTRSNATGIYARAMAVLMNATDEELIKGIHARIIYERAKKRQERIQYGNLKQILEKFHGLQVDDDGRGLILGYNSATEEVTIVDRQLLLYRRFATIKWPWEELIEEADKAGGKLEVE